MVEMAVEEEDGRCQVGSIGSWRGAVAMEDKGVGRGEEVGEDEVQAGGGKGEEVGIL